jgi:spermidine/putrescine transport system substrate-binding protein
MKNPNASLPGQTGQLTRRNILKAGAAAAGLTVGLSAPTIISRAEQSTLSWLTWPGHSDKSILEPFEKDTGIKVKAKEYGNGDLGLVEMSQNPGLYDVVTTSMEFMPQYVAAGIVEEMDPEQYKGWKEYLPEFQKDIGYNVGGKYQTIVYEFGFNALAYRTDKVSAEDASSFAILSDPRLSKKLGSQDWWGNTLGALSIAAGYSPAKGRNPYLLTNEEFAHLGDFIKKLRPQFGGFYEIAGIFTAFANGTIWVYPGGGDWAAQLLKDQKLPVESSIPKEGGYLWGEAISIVSGTKNREAAKKFVDYCLSAEAQVRFATKPSYSAIVPNGRAWTLLQQTKPDWGKRLKMDTTADPCAITPWRDGRIAVRFLPKDQTVEDWANLWQEFKSAS